MGGPGALTIGEVILPHPPVGWAPPPAQIARHTL
nr:MAG TPA: hypothetical protein [Bacteriophage sp.]